MTATTHVTTTPAINARISAGDFVENVDITRGGRNVFCFPDIIARIDPFHQDEKGLCLLCLDHKTP